MLQLTFILFSSLNSEKLYNTYFRKHLNLSRKFINLMSVILLIKFKIISEFTFVKRFLYVIAIHFKIHGNSMLYWNFHLSSINILHLFSFIFITKFILHFKSNHKTNSKFVHWINYNYCDCKTTFIYFI